MKIFRHYNNIPDDHKGAVVVLGNFDGFHKGHQEVVGTAGRIADEMKASLSVICFEPHPRIFFNPTQKEFRLTSFRTKSHLLEDFGVDQFFALAFDMHLCKMDPQDFVLDVLLKEIGALHIVVGYDYVFGAARRGGIDVLGWLSKMEQFGLTVVDKVMEGDHIYSSTNIRETIMQGDVRKTAERLGHWWHVEGHVKKGDQRGRTIGFPTANISIEGYIKPKLGVYAVRVEVMSGPHAGQYLGVANIGKRPTFDKTEVLLEVHLFDFDADIYEQSVKTEFVDFIRAERKFDGLETLKAQISLDSEKAKEILQAPENGANVIPKPSLKTHL
jgi:riboflavin kinase/FMN adenylyltransferase